MENRNKKQLIELIESKIQLFMRSNCCKPTHIIVSVDVFSNMQAELNPHDGYYVPSYMQRDLDSLDKVRGLVLSILPNYSVVDYVEVK